MILTRDADLDASADAHSPSVVGCADGRRDGFVEAVRFPAIAGCAGGFDVAGVRTDASRAITCRREAGDDGGSPSGAGCSVADLCAEGWHVCDSADDVSRHLPTGATCADVSASGAAPMFFLTRQSGSGFGQCDATGTDDLFGCGALGVALPDDVCVPLTRSSSDLCRSLPAPWSCVGARVTEALEVVKPGPGYGGALCCADP